MNYTYKVEVFVPKVAGCGASDNGWDQERIKQYQAFLNQHATGGWKLHSAEYRQVVAQGCGGGSGTWLVCIFERPA
ncbi:MAG TPA: DUF4177 domain-containing protein [Longimicrobium sp.]|nr:DUF4177 domain-containing protein [Longimicrobium sp.]